jgi:leucyl aminopeptidase
VELQKETLRSDVADMKNLGDRWGGAISAAIFLREFVGETPWAHLDIAGPAMAPRERGYQGRGATGIGVRTLGAFLEARARAGK